MSGEDMALGFLDQVTVLCLWGVGLCALFGVAYFIDWLITGRR